MAEESAASCNSGNTVPLTPKPMQLLGVDESSTNLVFQEETLAWLSQQEDQITVVSIVGQTGSGKSLFLNELVGQEGFVYENKIDGTTRGIWIWGIKHPSKENQILLLMDTEGQQDIERNESYDLKMGLMTMLLSSVMIFNVVKKIGSELIKQLGYPFESIRFVKQLHIKDKNSDDTKNLDKYLPSLLVLVRDFQCQLSFKGESVSPDTYFEECLKDSESDNWIKEGMSKIGLKKSNDTVMLNKGITEMFPSNKRNCRVLPNPFQDLKRMKLPAGVPTFENGVQDIMQLIIKIAKPKVFAKFDSVDGRVFVTLVRTYTEILNKGEDICIEPTFALIAKQENHRLLTEGIATYKNEMENLNYPLESNEFLEHHTKISQRVGETIIKKIIFNDPISFGNALQKGFVEIFNKMVEFNEKESQNKCKELLKTLYQEISTKLKAEEYYCSGGYEKYSQDMDELKKNYGSTLKKGLKAEEVLLEFLNEKESDRNHIITFDKHINVENLQREADKQMEEQRRKDEEERRRNQENERERTKVLAEQLQMMKQQLDMERERRMTDMANELRDLKNTLAEMDRRRSEEKSSGCSIS